MIPYDPSTQLPQDPLDRFALDLQHLRESKGQSYNDLAIRVSKLRVAQGSPAAAARTPRSTVYNCFRTGRARIDTQLLRDIVLALTQDEAEAEQWVDRYVTARKQAEEQRRIEAKSPTEPRCEPAPLVAPPAIPSIAPAAIPAEPPSATASISPSLAASVPLALTWQIIVLFIVVSVGMNRLGMALSVHLELTMFLDMLGTAFAAIVLGPWYGAAVAVLYQCFALVTYWDAGVLFGLANVTGALVWGFGIRRFHLGSTLSRFALLALITAVACSTVGVPINMIVTHLSTDSDSFRQTLEMLGLSYGMALLSENITVSIMDKLLSSFVALALFVFLHRKFGLAATHVPLVEHLGQLQSPPKSGNRSRGHFSRRR